VRDVHAGARCGLNSFDIDEICVVEGSFPAGRRTFKPALPRRENLVLASANSPATVDAAESFFMGYSPEFLRNFAEYVLHEIHYVADEEFLESYGNQYFLKLAEEAGMGRTSGFGVYTITPRASEIIPCDMLGLLRRGDVFSLPTFVRYAANTPLYERVPDADYEFKVEAPA
jgi:hypothetical protein